MGSAVGDSTLSEVETDELPEGITTSDLTPVEEVTSNLRGLFKGFSKFDDAYLVGEVSDVSSRSEHLYFSVNAARTAGTIKCLVWSSNRGEIALDLQADMLVAVKGTLQFFEGGGYPSLEVTEAHLVGESAYWRRIEQIRDRLETEGLFESAHKTSLPPFPTTVGLVTAAGSDAEQDLIDSIHGRYPDVNILVHDSTVQGSTAATELEAAIEAVDESIADVLVVSRGGGSETALRAFNEESVVRAVANAETPTVSAIGHEADEPLTDNVADVRVKTPTAAGEVVVADKEQYFERIEQATETITQAYATQVNRWLQTHRSGLVEEHRTQVDQWLDRQQTAIDAAYAALVDGWLRDTQRAIQTGYTTLSTNWIDTNRTSIRQEVASIEREYAFERERSGLQRRNAVLLAIVVILVLLLVAVLVLTLGIV